MRQVEDGYRVTLVVAEICSVFCGAISATTNATL